MDLLKKSWQRLKILCTKPAAYFSAPAVSLLDGALIIGLLLLATFGQKLAWQQPGIPGVGFAEALQQAAINSLLVWSLFSLFFYAIAEIFRKRINFFKLAGMAGSAGLPVVIVTLFSALTWWIGSSFNLAPIMRPWLLLQNGLSWIGLALGWPGVGGYLLMREGLKIPQIWAIVICVLTLAVFIASGVFAGA